MNTTPLHWLRNTLIAVSATVLLTACTEEAPIGPNALKAPLAALPGAALATRAVDLSACPDLKVSAGSELVFHAYAKGVQIYHWNGSIWAFDGPSAVLFADAEGKSTVGTHSAGPIWESMSGGKVAGAILKKCFVDPNSIPWLLLSATPIEGAGVFQQATLIQRVNTVGGNAPSYNGTLGEEARVPYTTEYLFYRAP